MSNSGSQDDKVRALEHEVRTLKREVRLLQSARTFKVATYGKRLLKSHPKDIAKNLKSLPEVLKREHIPAIESTDQSGRSHFSSATRPSSLYRFPNINVAIVDDGNSFKFLYDTCSALHYSDTTAELIANYEALQIIVINPTSTIDTTHLAKLIHPNQKIIIFGREEDVNSPLRSILDNSEVHYVSPESLPPTIDVYNITPTLELHTLDAPTKLNSLDEGAELKTDSLNTISFDKLIGLVDKGDMQIMEYIFAMNPAIVVTSEDGGHDSMPTIKVSEINNLALDTNAITRQLIRQHNYVVRHHNSITAATALFDIVGIKYDDPSPSVGVLISTKRFAQLRHIVDQVTQQEYPLSAIAIGLHGFSRDDINSANKLVASLDDDRISLYDFSADTLFGDVLNSLVDSLDCEFVAKMDDDDYYGPQHITDLVIAQLYSDADVVGKWNNWVYFPAESKVYSWAPENAMRYTNHIPGGAIMLRRSMLQSLKFGMVRRAIDSEFYRRAIPRGALLYSTHRYNFVRVRHDDHTYKADPEEWKARSERLVVDGLDTTKLYV